jgi:CRP/FNR family transcriptional regulator, cyclic AMP receptor protein
MLQIVSYETFQDGEIVFKEGDEGDRLYLIDSGSVELSKWINGDKAIVETLQAGEVLGEMEFLNHMPRAMTAMAMGKTSIGIVDCSHLTEELNKLSEDARAIIRVMVLRLKKESELLTRSAIKR